MTFEQIKENILMSEIYPDSGKINFGELSLETIYQWAVQVKELHHDNMVIYDIESVKSAIQEWAWSTGLLKKREVKPLVFDDTVANKIREEQYEYSDFIKRHSINVQKHVSNIIENWKKS